MEVCFNRTVDLVRDAVKSGAVPAAAVGIGCGDKRYRMEVFGKTSYTEEGEEAGPETAFDMASVTKIMAPAILALQAVETGKLDLCDSLPRYFKKVPEEKRNISIFQLMTHTSGLPAHIRLSNFTDDPEQACRVIIEHPVEGVPGGQVIYSCVGFILLGKILEKLYGEPLDRLAKRRIFEPLGMEHTGYRRISETPAGNGTGFAFTEKDKKSGAWLAGTVHDENARFLDGVSGNAGVFSTLKDMMKFASCLACGGKGLLSGAMFRAAVKNYTPGMEQNRGLGFHLANGYDSYSGAVFDQNAFGHTGFTGTSLLVSRESGLYAVLLTNRVHPDRTISSVLRLRRTLHTVAASEFEGCGL